jgi:hypothetical protein
MLARNVDIQCLEFKAEAPLHQADVSRRKAELALKTMAELDNFNALQIAERAVATEISNISGKTELTPKQREAQRLLATALQDLRAGIAATERLVQERCGTRERRIFFM